jgi:hypothetical protein
MFVLIMGIIFLSGCAGFKSKPPRMYWGYYSKSLYEYKKSPTPANLKAHEEALLDIISTSKEFKILPPPGVSAELGSLYLKEGKHAQGVALINQEAHDYPESQQLMALVLKKANQPSASE